MRCGNPRASSVLDETIAVELSESQIETPRHAERCPATRGAISRQIMSRKATHGSGHGGWYWFRESHPAADAVLILAHVLQGLSRSDAAFSQRLQQSAAAQIT